MPCPRAATCTRCFARSAARLFLIEHRGQRSVTHCAGAVGVIADGQQTTGGLPPFAALGRLPSGRLLDPVGMCTVRRQPLADLLPVAAGDEQVDAAISGSLRRSIESCCDGPTRTPSSPTAAAARSASRHAGQRSPASVSPSKTTTSTTASTRRSPPERFSSTTFDGISATRGERGSITPQCGDNRSMIASPAASGGGVVRLSTGAERPRRRQV